MSNGLWMESVPEADSTDEHPTEPSADVMPDGGGVPAWRFRLAVARHAKIVYRIAAAMLKDRHEAEDVTQEAFLRYWQHGAGVRHQREWLLAVARNACFDRLRRAGRIVDAERAAAEQSDERGPAWHFQQGELAARLKGRIAALPEPQRSLVILFDVHGFDGAACARILGLSTNQVKVYLHRARRRLRRELEGSL